MEYLANTSGTGPDAEIPNELRGWNWGAFLLSWVWGIGNHVWFALFALVPGLGLIVNVLLGMKGNQWAWQSRKWESVEHLKRAQKAWARAGVVLIVVTFVLAPILIACADYALSKVTSAFFIPGGR